MELKPNYYMICEELDMLTEQSLLVTEKPRLIAVSKMQPEERVDALLEAGHRVFGENRLQEAVLRWEERRKRHKDIQLHFLGVLQTNKAAEVVAFFDAIHSVDRPKLASHLAKAMKEQSRALPCYIQVNTGEEPQKSGVLPADLPDFFTYCRELELNVVGLMCLPPAGLNPAPHFALLRQMAITHQLPRLSMGMSGDWQTAVRMGATDIRIGTALFGERGT